MNFKSLKRDELDERKLPDSIYKSVVSSLYADANSLAIGIFCCIAGALVLYWKTLDPVQLVFAVLFLIMGAARLMLASLFEKASKHSLSIKTYRVWENRYNLISTAYVIALGLWYAIGLSRSDDPYVQLLSLSLILCYLIGIIGRNFASNKVVRSQVIAVIILLIGGAMFFDDFYGLTLTLFLLPFLGAIHFMSTRLRAMLFKAEINALNSSTIANRFDVALENVTHGIAMHDNTGTIVVANERFMRLASMGDWEIIGCHISILETVKIEQSIYSTLAAQIQNCIEQKQSVQFSFGLLGGKLIEAEYNSMVDGGVIVLSDVSERKASEKVIRDLANFDPLTNLSNRRHFVQGVEQLFSGRGNKRPASMLFIDLDKFKEVNDTLGHSVGDELLRVIASRLRLLLDKQSMLCRFGGDEFVIFSTSLQDRNRCVEFVENLLRELHVPVIVSNHQIDISASIGIALSPDHGEDANSLLQHADAALYDAKARGRSTYSFYSDDMGEALRKKREMESDLRRALQNDELRLHYQPLVDYKNGIITTCEALARWHHPTLGNIPPSVFIQMAEETGMILELGEVVLRKAMIECLNWPDNMRVAVNVSSIQFQRGDVYTLVRKTLAETGLPASKLDIEVTESAMIDNLGEISVTLEQLSALGVNISLDDFGTGFSSLSYLHTLPFDKVKIDKSFVENGIASKRSLILLQSVVDLIKRLGLRVVLEGIETQEQLNVMLKTIEVDEFQGFLFFKPMAPVDIMALIEEIASLQDKKQPQIA